jgi:hypothetical protein
MKKFVDKVSRLEGKAKRKLLQKQAREHDRQARKFRQDAMKLGCELAVAGENLYNKHHPVYEELIMPLLDEAARLANKYGFNVLYQTHTPLPGQPMYSHAIGSMDSRTVTPTMKACVDLIQARPKLSSTAAELITDRAEPAPKSDTDAT